MRTGVLGVVREEKDGGRGNVLSVVFPGAWEFGDYLVMGCVCVCVFCASQEGFLEISM